MDRGWDRALIGYYHIVLLDVVDSTRLGRTGFVIWRRVTESTNNGSVMRYGRVPRVSRCN